MTIFNSYVENYQRVIISEFFDLRSDVSTTGWIQGTFWIRLAARVLYRHGTLFNIPSLVWWFWMYWLCEESRLFQYKDKLIQTHRSQLWAPITHKSLVGNWYPQLSKASLLRFCWRPAPPEASCIQARTCWTGFSGQHLQSNSAFSE